MSVKTKHEIANDSRLLKEVSKKLIGKLKDHGVSDEVIFDVHVGFEEALRNAMVHGNKSHPEKRVTIEAEFDDEKLVLTVEDEGEGFDLKALPDPTVEDNLLKESGRGVYLIRHLMDEVEYTNSGRKVMMKKYFNK